MATFVRVFSPYSFEKVAFTTPAPTRALCMLSHILKLFPRNATEQQKAETKRLADSVYQSDYDRRKILKK